MGHYINILVNYLHQNPHLGILITFIIAFLESLPLVGTLIPGSITMTAIGTLLGTGILPMYTTLAWAMFGAFLGDCVGFWIGRRYQNKLLNMWPFKKHPKWLTISEDFFKRHGGKSIIVGRFAGPVRSTIPLAAGLLQMSWPRFILAAAPSAILWALLYMFPGILLGALSMELPASKTTEFILTGLAVIFCIWLIFWLIQKTFRQIGKVINFFIDRSWNWLNRQHSSKFFIKAITNKQQPSDHHQLLFVILCLLCVLGFFYIVIQVFYHLSLTHLNKPLFLFFQSLRNKPVDTFFILVTFLGTPFITVFTGFCVAIGLAWKKEWRFCFHLLAIIALTIMSVALIKTIYHSARPEDFMVFDKSTSFPSGHGSFSLAIYGFLAFIIAEKTSKDLKILPYAAMAVLVFLIMLSRIYLGAHWLTDILGSLFLGLALLFAVITSYRRNPKQDVNFNASVISLLMIFVLSLGVTWALSNYFLFNKIQRRFTPYSVEYNVTKEQWLRRPLQFLPPYRDNRFGDPIQPFNIQWMGEIKEIQDTLLQKGWRQVEKQKFVKKTLQRFASYNPEYHMSLFPWLYLNRAPTLLFIKNVPGDTAIIELRLWQTHVHFLDAKAPLWIGTINRHTPPQKLLALRNGSKISFALPDVVEILKKDLGNSFNSKALKVDYYNQPPRIRDLNWDGKILILYKK